MKNANQRSNAVDVFENSSTKNTLNAIAFRYLPFWPIFVFAIIVSLTISYIYIHYQTPIYEANASILLKDDKSSNSDVLASLDVTSNTAKTVDNEIEVLKSRTLVRQVARDMGLYAQVWAKGTFRDIIVYPNPVKFIAINPDALENSPNIPVSFKYVFSGKYIILGGIRYSLNVPVKTPYGEFIIQPVKEVYDPEAQYGKSKDQLLYLQVRSVKTAGAIMQGSLTVAPLGKQSSLISLKMADQSPLRAQDELNDLINVYNKAGVDDKNGAVANTLQFINNRLITVTKDLNDVEGDLQKYRSERGIIDLTSQGKDYLDNVNKSDQSLSQIQIQFEVLDEIEKYIKQKADQAGTVPATVGITDPILSSLLEKLYDAELTLAHDRETSGENSPAINSLKDQISQLKLSLLENTRNLRQNLIATKNGLQADIDKNSGILKSVPEKEHALLEINRQQAVKNAIYTFLLQKREDAEISYASAVADSRVVNYAESGGAPIKPIPLNIYLIGLSVGVFFGVFFVLIREQFNRTVVFRSDIETTTGAPILAEIMHDESGETLVIQDGKRTTIAEQFRALRTSLNYIGIHDDKKTLLLTSSISGEGKSFTCMNIAVSLALTGKKVVLLEFDLRKPRVSKALNIKQEPGISNYLAGLATYNEIIIPLESINIPGLFLLPAGSIPPNPTELMLNGQLNVLMDQLKRDFDYILIDSPPVGLVTDAKILNRYSDACLYMVRHKYTPKHYLNLIEQLYANDELNNLNVVFNGLTARGVLNNYGGYGTSYGYGYGYGYGSEYGYTQDNDKKQTFGVRLRTYLKQLLK